MIKICRITLEIQNLTFWKLNLLFSFYFNWLFCWQSSVVLLLSHLCTFTLHSSVFSVYICFSPFFSSHLSAACPFCPPPSSASIPSLFVFLPPWWGESLPLLDHSSILYTCQSKALLIATLLKRRLVLLSTETQCTRLFSFVHCDLFCTFHQRKNNRNWQCTELMSVLNLKVNRAPCAVFLVRVDFMCVFVCVYVSPLCRGGVPRPFWHRIHVYVLAWCKSICAPPLFSCRVRQCRWEVQEGEKTKHR